MFLSHLNVFILFIALLLFLLRLKNKNFSEIIIFLFCLQTFISSTIWLYINYYNQEFSIFIDYFGILNENILLIYCNLFIWSIGREFSFKEKILKISGVFVLSLLLFFIHLGITKNSKYIFYPTNLNIEINIGFQVLLDLIFYFIFIKLLRSTKSKNQKELFDGGFKKYITFGFIFYFIQDIFILILLYLGIKGILFPDYLMEICSFINLFSSVALVIIVIYINWLPEYNLLRFLNNEKNNKVKEQFEISDLQQLKNIDWITIQNSFTKKYPEIIESIKGLSNLSKTEKMYAFFEYFDIQNKKLADILNVSLRTVETNFYRMRKKTENKSKF